MTALGRWAAVAILALFVAAGLGGVEEWPLTGWKLFSLDRRATQVRWVIEVLDDRGMPAALDLDELPMPYRQAEWLLVRVPDLPVARRDALCAGLLTGARAEVAAATGLHIVRDRQRLVRREGRWSVDHDPEVVHRCERRP